MAPLITFGMIVLNGMPFIPYNMRTIYPYAHQIIVVEGAAPAASKIATHDGHSTDQTLSTLKKFQEDEDPERKLLIVTAEDDGYPDGFWPGEKHQQSQIYARYATGDYLWQVDVDEFYRSDDIESIMDLLTRDVSISAVSFKTITFWGGFDIATDGWYLRRGAAQYHRLFRWRPGYRYATHRPPTVIDSHGKDLRSMKWLDGYTLEKRGIVMYHYSLLFPRQVIEKCMYYQRVDWTERKRAVDWYNKNYMKLKNHYRVHNVYDYPSWLEKYLGSHPDQIINMQRDLIAGTITEEMRPMDDVRRLVSLPFYQTGVKFLKKWDYADRLWQIVLQVVIRLLRLIKRLVIKLLCS